MFRILYRFIPDNNSIISRGATELAYKRIVQICQIIWAGYLKKYVCSIWKLLLDGESPVEFEAILDDGGEQIHKREYRQKLI